MSALPLLICFYQQSGRHRNLPIQRVSLIAFQLHTVGSEVVEVGDAAVEAELRGVEGLPVDQLLHHRDVPVVDVAIGDDVDQLPGLKTGDLGDHGQQDGVLHHIPAVGGKHVLAALVQDGVESVPRHVEGHGVSTGVESHLA